MQYIRQLNQRLPKIMVGHPLHGTTVSHNFYRGMITLARTYKGELDFQISQAFSAPFARESLAQKFLTSDSDYLFFIDTDIGITAGSLEKLLFHQKDMITAMAFNKQYPFSPRIYKLIDDQKGYAPIIDYPEGVIGVDACGGDCLLIKKTVFEKVPKPWFIHPRVDYTEDIFFCRKVKEAGISIFADTTIKTLHDASMTINEAMFKGNKK